VPLEKRHVENGVKFLEAFRQGGLADPEGRGCLRKTMLRADCVNGSKMMKFQSLIEVPALAHDSIDSENAVAAERIAPTGLGC
jgi:hypothetical protein